MLGIACKIIIWKLKKNLSYLVSISPVYIILPPQYYWQWRWKLIIISNLRCEMSESIHSLGGGGSHKQPSLYICSKGVIYTQYTYIVRKYKNSKTDFFLSISDWLIDWLLFNVQPAIFQLYSGREHLRI